MIPGQASVQCLLDDGRLLTVHASSRLRDGRADIKCHGPREIALHVQQVLRLARHTEADHDSRVQVVISLDPWPQTGQREWELALVLADRMVRGLYQPSAARVFAHGWSGDWQRGQVQGGDATRYAPLLQAAAPAMLVLGAPSPEEKQANNQGNIQADNRASAQAGNPASAQEVNPAKSQASTRTSTQADNPAGNHAGCFPITHLGALHGHPDPAGLVASSRCWFPLYSGGVHDSLNWLDVSVRPLVGALPDEAVISVLGLDLPQQQAVLQVLQAARLFEQKSTRQWRAVVHFGHGGFYGDSWQLALVMADRIARGRDFPARARLIATGRSGAWHTGMVETVAECDAKCALILREAQRGDRVLLPAAWEPILPAGFLTQLAARGASCACVGRLGLL